MEKKCTACKTPLPLDDFYKNKYNKDGHAHECKDCSRSLRKEFYRENANQKADSQLRRRYGITLDDYDEILLRQKRACKICGKTMKSRLHVDHDHTTGKIRGLLCSNCNRGIGLFYDNPLLLEAAGAYIRSN